MEWTNRLLNSVFFDFLLPVLRLPFFVMVHIVLDGGTKILGTKIVVFPCMAQSCQVLLGRNIFWVDMLGTFMKQSTLARLDNAVLKYEILTLF